MAQNFFIITGAMGSGKSTICQEVEAQGQLTIAEPARQILAEQRSFNGAGVPEKDPKLFTDLMLSRALYLYKLNRESRKAVLFDRGVPDMIAYASLFNLDTGSYEKAAQVYRYNPTVFFMADWEEIYTTDDERKMSYEQARGFGQSVRKIYADLGYELIEVPQMNVEDRARFICERIG